MSVNDWREVRGFESSTTDPFAWTDPRLVWIRRPFDDHLARMLQDVIHPLQRPGDELVDGHAFVLTLTGADDLEAFERFVTSLAVSSRSPAVWPDAYPHVFVALEVRSQSELERLLPQFLALPAPRRALIALDFVPDLAAWACARTDWIPPKVVTWDDELVKVPAWIPDELLEELRELWPRPLDYLTECAERGAPPVPAMHRGEWVYLHLDGNRGAEVTAGGRWSYTTLEEQRDREHRPVDWIIVQGTDAPGVMPLAEMALEFLARNAVVNGIPLWFRGRGQWRNGFPLGLLRGRPLEQRLPPGKVDLELESIPEGLEVAAYFNRGGRMECKVLTPEELWTALEGSPSPFHYYASRGGPRGGRQFLEVFGRPLDQGPYRCTPDIASHDWAD